MTTNDKNNGLPTGYRVVTTGEIRARLQPIMLMQVQEPVKSITGRMRFEAGDLVMAQFWGGGGFVILHPVDPRKGQPAFCVASGLGGKLAVVEQSNAADAIGSPSPGYLAAVEGAGEEL